MKKRKITQIMCDHNCEYNGTLVCEVCICYSKFKQKGNKDG